MKILVIEDEILLAYSLKTLLCGKGFDVEVALDGQTGAEYAELGTYDLLILDIMMSGLDEYEIIRKVRQQHINTHILILTAKSGAEYPIQGLAVDADCYLAKPFDSRELLACINTLMKPKGNQIDELIRGNTVLDVNPAH